MKNVGNSVPKRFQFGLFYIVLLWRAAVASAQKTDQQDPSEEKDQDQTHWSVGGGFIASPRPYIGMDPKLFPFPVVGLRHKGWFVQGIRGGYDVVQKGALTGSVFAQARLRGLEPEASPFLDEMEPRRKSVDAGGELIYRARPLGFRAAFLTDVLGRSKGQEVSLLAVTGAPFGGALFLLGVGPRWLSSKRVDYYFGVQEHEARSWRPAYEGTATWNLDISLTVNLRITDRWRLFALVNREGFGSGIRTSPLLDRSSAYSLITSLTYNF